MAHRKLQDETGRWWDVWDTHPTIIDRRAGRERRTGRRTGDRRQRSEPRVVVEPEYRDGWLAFQSGTEWRRLAPIPKGWERLSEQELLALLEQAAHGEARHA
jgi:hypothetical protein